MKRKILMFGIVGAVLVASGWGLYVLGGRNSAAHPQDPEAANQTQVQMPATEDPSAWSIAQGEVATRRHISSGLQAGDTDPATGLEILYYHDPMMPGKKFEIPAKSPYMDMMLVPAYATGQNADTNLVTISPRMQQNLGLRTGKVIRGELAPSVAAIGAVTWNERNEVTLQARATGFVEKLHVRAALDAVAQGEALLDLRVPEWVAVQEEYLALLEMDEEQEVVAAARQRMRQVGMDEQQIERVADTKQLQEWTQLRAPMDGVVIELLVREGSTVMPGTPLLRINSLATVWAEAEVPESQAGLLQVGSPVAAKAPALPGQMFEGKVQALLLEIDPRTRTRRARVELENRDAKLIPGALVQMTLHAEQNRATLLVPTEAVIQTGARTLVMLAEEDGVYRPVEVEVGRESGEYTEIRRGLAEGQSVVLSGQFLLDSEASLRGIDAQPIPSESAEPPAHAAAQSRQAPANATSPQPMESPQPNESSQPMESRQPNESHQPMESHQPTESHQHAVQEGEHTAAQNTEPSLQNTEHSAHRSGQDMAPALSHTERSDQKPEQSVQALTQPAQRETYATIAEVKARDGDILTLHHAKVPALEWPTMTMDFRLAPALHSWEVPVGEPIEIEFWLPETGAPEILQWHRIGAGP